VSAARAGSLAAVLTACQDGEALRLLAPLGAEDLRGVVMALRAALVPAPPVCRSCGRQRKRRAGGGWEGGRDLCGACYHRARDAGFPAVVPPPVPPGEITAAGGAATQARRAERFTAYCVLRSRRVLPHWAAQRVGLGPGYKAALQYEREYQAARQREVA
jgi:hypothetical protein